MTTTLNRTLMKLAQDVVWRQGRNKAAAVPAGGGAPPMGAGGGMPPAAGGGMPPMDPAAMGMMPPADPAAGGMMPPADPSMGMMPPAAGGMMPADPSMMGGAPPMAGGQPGQPGQAGQPPQKMDQKQMMLAMDYRLYNIQQQLTAIMNSMNISLPPGALITPPGSPIPVAEAALPGGPQDPGINDQSQQGGGGGASAIPPIDPMAGASPAPGGGAEKQGMDFLTAFQSNSVGSNAAALLQLLRSRTK